jgi:hypothetical protein
MKEISRNTILPALIRPGMFTGEQGNRSIAEWHADAVVEYLKAMQILEERYSNSQAGEPTPSEMPSITIA